MDRAGRSQSIASVRISRFLYIFAVIKLVTCTEYGIPIEIKLWDSKRSPLAHMVDVTNEFGLKVLAEHNFLNDNNIAFSPYGLMGILVALYEGVDGESSYQIQRSMQLPWNRNIMRIGFRDIHRTLKTYFIPEEGFLAGLALNNENTTFNESYKKILRYYGFDLESEQSPTFKPNNTTDIPQTTTINLDSTSTSATPTMITIGEQTTNPENSLTKAPREETTAKPQSNTINVVDIKDSETVTIASTSTLVMTPTTNAAPPTETAQQLNTVSTAAAAILSDDSTTQIVTQETGSTVSSGSTINMNDIPTTLLTSFNADISTTTDSTTSVTDIMKVTQITLSNTVSETLQTEQMLTMLNTETSTSDSSSKTSTFSLESDSPSTISASTLESDSTSTTSTSTLESDSSTTPTSTLDSESSLTTSTSTLETLERRKKSIVDFLYTSPPYGEDYLVYRSFGVGTNLPKENPYENTMFMVNGLRNIQVSYMSYDSILEYAYLPHLEASALRLPLDSERYYLLVVLPARRGPGELGRLLARMARESDLSDVYAALNPRRVRAVVPSFLVKGHVALTTDLQKIGIRDVFEPRQQDFTPMTQQTGVYVHSIEQAVTVAIRKYQPDDVKNRYISNRSPVLFTATYPFLYFVMDTNIHVALMAGKMVDPLNTRIV